MSAHDVTNFLQTLISKDFSALEYARKPRTSKSAPAPRVITISRDYGALGEQIAAKLAEVLGIPVYDQEILDQVAQRTKTDKFYLQSHDEQQDAGVSSFIYSLISGPTVTQESYRRALYDVVLDLSSKDCILVGRGAHLILVGKPVFKLRLVGSKRVCAERVAAEFGISIPEAEQRVFEINNKRHKSIAGLYGANFRHASLEFAANFDLTLNTDHFTADGAAAVVLLAMQQSGITLQKV